jgi:lipid II:glycine glycyltransferase (peptidoglycan interpeptide bridge formation enzyme)
LVKKDAPFSKTEFLLDLIKHLQTLGRADFIRIAPLWPRTKENKVLFKELGFREAPIHMHPEITWQLGLTSSEQDLLMQMRKTTRYLIRQSLKNKEIKIVQSKNPEDLKIFNQLYSTTASRHNFVPFSLDYLENEFQSFVNDDQIMIFLGKHRGEVLVSAIALFWQNIAFYHHGASVPSKLPLSYGVQWSIIQEARKRGCTLYNFWGIADDQKPGFKNHPWWGLTLFKKGFGGYEKRYLKTQDFVLSPKYCLNFLVEKIRKIKRHL